MKRRRGGSHVRRIVRVGVCCALGVWHIGVAAAQSQPGPWQSCDLAASEAEHDFALPSGLLTAIGRVESGRWDAASRRSSPWPYAIDVGGYDLFMDDRDTAAAKVRALQAAGIQSIDVGCFQINLMYHPDAFATIEQGFDPSANAAYAARFLTSLRQRTGSWEAAVAGYHSLSPDVGEPYRARVYANWSAGGGGTPGEPSGRASLAATNLPVGGGWMPAVSVRVIVPAAFVSVSAGSMSAPQKPAAAFSDARAISTRRAGLPRVFTPSNG